MKENNFFSGVWSAVPTPFLSDFTIDYRSLDKMISYQKNLKGLVVCGTTGESPALSFEEKVSLISYISKKTTVIAGSGGNNTDDTLRLSEAAVSAGAQALLVVTPPYNKPNPQGMIMHFEKIAKSVDVPICLYHVPGRTGQFLSLELMTEICGIAGIDAVKEASGDVAFFAKAAAQNPNTCFLSGDDPTYLASLSVGGKGCVSVCSNVLVNEFLELTKAFFAGDVNLATKLNSKYIEFTDLLFIETNPVPLKAALSIMGQCENILRLPLAPLEKSHFEMLNSKMKELQIV